MRIAAHADGGGDRRKVQCIRTERRQQRIDYTWLAGRRLFPRYAVIATLLVGIAVAASRGLLHAQQVHLQLAIPQWVTPSLSWTAVAGIALPLFVVTMASQNIPGVAVMRLVGTDGLCRR